MRLTQNSAKSITLLVCTTTIALICTSLAVWQYQRSQQKLDIINKLDKLTKQGVLPWHQLTSLPQDWVATGLNVSLAGALAEQYWWLDNRVVNGQFGYDLIIAVKPLNASRWWLVNMGWFVGSYQRETLPEVTLPQPLSLVGILKVSDFEGFNLANSRDEIQQGQRLQFISPQLASQLLEQEVAPYIIYANEQHAVGKYHYQVINMSPDKHRAYALQWILLALAAVVVGGAIYRKGGSNE